MNKIKFFLDPINNVEKYLNEMSEKAYRLKSLRACFYEFEKTDIRYRYTTQFIGANPSEENKKYISMIEENEEYKVFRVPINQGNFNYGKMRLRPFTREKLKTSTYWGNFNKEILVVEYKDNQPMNLLTNNCDIAKQYKDIRNAYLQGLIGVLFIFLLSIYKIYQNGFAVSYGIVFCIVLSLLIMLTIFIQSAHNNFKNYNEKSKLEEY